MVAWSPDGKSLAAVGYGGNATVRIWRAEAERVDGPVW
jgi:hypothetical protein